MTAHSPEPWAYDEDAMVIGDATGALVADVYGGSGLATTKEYTATVHANGRRIAALSAENAALRAILGRAGRALETLIGPPETIGSISRRLRHESLAEIRTALRAGGAEKGVGT